MKRAQKFRLPNGKFCVQSVSPGQSLQSILLGERPRCKAEIRIKNASENIEEPGVFEFQELESIINLNLEIRSLPGIFRMKLWAQNAT